MARNHRVTALLRTDHDLSETRRMLKEIATGERPVRRYKFASGEFDGRVADDWFRFQRSVYNYAMPYIVGHLRDSTGGTEIALESEAGQIAGRTVILFTGIGIPMALAALVAEFRIRHHIVPGIYCFGAALAWLILYYINRVRTYPRRFRLEVEYLAKLLDARIVEDVKVVHEHSRDDSPATA